MIPWAHATRLTFLVGATILLAADISGTYKGSYSRSAGAIGDFQISLSQSSGVWKAQVSFGLGGHQFEFQGATLESTAIGELKGNKFEGTYQTTSVPDGTAVDQGTWNAARQ